jgi:hypothetical protein
MRSGSLRGVAGIVLLVFAGCEARSDSASRTGADVEQLLGIGESGVDTMMTLASWLKASPQDSISLAPPLYSYGDDESFCRTAVGRSTLSNHRTARFASFHIAAPPDEELLRDSVGIAEQACRLRTIWLETEDTDSVSAHTLADSLAKALDAKLGAGQPGTRLSEGTTIKWADARTWSRPGTRIVVATAPSDRNQMPETSSRKSNNSSTARVATGRKVIMIAYSQASAIPDQDFFNAKFEQSQRDEAKAALTSLEDADSAIAWADLPSIGADLRTMIAELRRSREKSDTLRNPVADSALVHAVLATRDTAPTLNPPREAAALIAAELVRYAAVPFPPPAYLRNPATALFSSLQSIIAGSDVDGFDPHYVFNRLWLWKAYDVDSLGRAGHIAFVTLLARGFDESVPCARDIGFYTEVINRGEAALRRGDPHPMVHYYVGAAYKSISDIGNSDPGDYVDSIPSKPEAEAARLRAIDHFRAALASLRDKPTRRDAWEMATKLMLRTKSRAWNFCGSEDD